MIKCIKPSYILLAFIFFFSTSCKTTKKTAVDTDSYQKLTSALLWEISGNKLEASSYLYGTIHMINTEDFYWPKGTLAALDESDQITFEIDLDDMTDMGAQMSLMTKAFMADGKTLQDLLSEEDYKKVSDHFSGMGLPMFMLDKIKPMFLTVFASGDMDLTGLQSEKIKSYEMEIYEIANNSNKEVFGLESMEYQMSIFDSIPYTEQATMLVDAIGASDTENDQFKDMVDTYKTQNIEGMIELMHEEEAGVGEYEDLLLNDRNQNWIPVMGEQMKTKRTFFAVGAGHLAGKNGVIHLLQKAGYKLTPLSQVE